MSQTGHVGLHLTSGASRFVMCYLAPLVLAENWDKELMARVWNQAPPAGEPAMASRPATASHPVSSSRPAAPKPKPPEPAPMPPTTEPPPVPAEPTPDDSDARPYFPAGR
jgi:hypothetical protein